MNDLNDFKDAGWFQGADGTWSKPKNRANDPRKSPDAEQPVGHVSSKPNPIEAPNPGKIRISVVDVRKRLVDEDGLIAKYHVDALRYSSIVRSDAPGEATIQVSQRKVLPGEVEHTEITIEPIQ